MVDPGVVLAPVDPLDGFDIVPIDEPLDGLDIVPVDEPLDDPVDDEPVRDPLRRLRVLLVDVPVVLLDPLVDDMPVPIPGIDDDIESVPDVVGDPGEVPPDEVFCAIAAVAISAVARMIKLFMSVS